MTPLRQRMIEDLQLRNRTPRTIQCYVGHVRRFAAHFGVSPEQLGPEDVRAYQLHLLSQRVSWSAFNQCVSALRFLYGVTLGRREPFERLAYGIDVLTIQTILGHATLSTTLLYTHVRRDRLKVAGQAVDSALSLLPLDHLRKSH